MQVLGTLTQEEEARTSDQSPVEASVPLRHTKLGSYTGLQNSSPGKCVTQGLEQLVAVWVGLSQVCFAENGCSIWCPFAILASVQSLIRNPCFCALDLFEADGFSCRLFSVDSWA